MMMDGVMTLLVGSSSSRSGSSSSSVVEIIGPSFPDSTAAGLAS